MRQTTALGPGGTQPFGLLRQVQPAPIDTQAGPRQIQLNLLPVGHLLAEICLDEGKPQVKRIAEKDARKTRGDNRRNADNAERSRGIFAR
jgi:hypothetical protein